MYTLQFRHQRCSFVIDFEIREAQVRHVKWSLELFYRLLKNDIHYPLPNYPGKTFIGSAGVMSRNKIEHDETLIRFTYFLLFGNAFNHARYFKHSKAYWFKDSFRKDWWFDYAVEHSEDNEVKEFFSEFLSSERYRDYMRRITVVYRSFNYISV